MRGRGAAGAPWGAAGRICAAAPGMARVPPRSPRGYVSDCDYARGSRRRVCMRLEELSQRGPRLPPANPPVVRPAEPEGCDRCVSRVAQGGAEYLARRRAGVVNRYRAVPEERRGLEPPGEEIGEGSHFLPQEVPLCPLGGEGESLRGAELMI